jgi:hypothetical protein
MRGYIAELLPAAARRLAALPRSARTRLLSLPDGAIVFPACGPAGVRLGNVNSPEADHW